MFIELNYFNFDSNHCIIYIHISFPFNYVHKVYYNFRCFCLKFYYLYTYLKLQTSYKNNNLLKISAN